MGIGAYFCYLNRKIKEKSEDVINTPHRGCAYVGESGFNPNKKVP